MKKIQFLLGICVFVFAFSSCQKKSKSNVNTGFKDEAGTGANPFKNQKNVSTNTGNLANANSNYKIGGNGWTNSSCASTQFVAVRGINGILDATISFYSPPTSGTYSIVEAPSQNFVCAITLSNAPNQPIGTVWYGKKGVVSVTTTPFSIMASFTDIICKQKNFDFPTVTASGTLGCN
jgi:hypothetical protein